jgi:hypothetical protein
MGVVPQSAGYNTDDLELNIGMIFYDGDVNFQFRSGRKYFFAFGQEDYSKNSQIVTYPFSPQGLEGRKVRLHFRSAGIANPENYDDMHAVFRPSPNILAELNIAIEPYELLDDILD